MLRLIKFFWTMHCLYAEPRGPYGKEFQACRGITQGGPLSPKLFNIMVNAIVRVWLRLVLGEEASTTRIRAAVRLNVALFYADEGCIASTYPEKLQSLLDVLIKLFERADLLTNTSKTKAEVCIDR